MKLFKRQTLALALGLILAGCGGGTADTTPKISITSVKVFGDSLQDSGTFGIKFTVQDASTRIYVERVAAAYGKTLCPAFAFTGVTFVAGAAGCTNFAIGGGVVNYAGLSTPNALDPRGIPLQLATAGAGGFSATDLLIVDGGGNDAAALVSAYLNAPVDGGAKYVTLLSSLLTPEQVAAAVGGGSAGLAAAGGTYMTALADLMYASLKTNALDKGATRVVLMNAPGITNTPRFQTVLDAVAAATTAGGGDGAAARAATEALVMGWVKAYNAELAAKVGSDARVALVDFFTAFNDQIATPAQFGLTNVKTPACPIVGVGSDGLPAYDFPSCTATFLSAHPPSGVTDTNWWKSYAFSDSFHPTPYGHQLVGQLISKSLAIKGWL